MIPREAQTDPPPVAVTTSAYWERHLEGAPKLTDLPLDRARPVARTAQQFRVCQTVARPVTEALETIARTRSVDLSVVLLASFKVFLLRWTAQQDLVIGVRIEDWRGLPSLDEARDGLPVRSDLSGNPSFIDVLSRVQSGLEAARGHRSGARQLQPEQGQPEPDESHAPVFQVVFHWRHASSDTDAAPTALSSGLSATALDLALTVADTGEALLLTWECSADVLEEPTLERMGRHFVTLLEGIAADPARGVATLPLLTPGDRDLLLERWNATRVEYEESCIHELFESQVRKTPEAIAVEFRGSRLTYAALNRQANQLAHRLRALGVDAGARVGLCVERSPEMIVGQLGILKAGGSYVPLDPVYPQERLAFMAKDAGLDIVLTQANLQPRLWAIASGVVCLDSDWNDIETEPGDDLPSVTTPRDPMYVLYTSGSTGTPKGVIVSHRAVSNYIAWFHSEYGIDPQDRVLQFHSFAFDVSVEEIFPTLTAGAALVLRSDDIVTSIPGFLQTCADLSISILDLPTAFWHELSAGFSASTVMPESVRLVLIAGERALGGALANWQRGVAPRVRLSNRYGPTEATIIATHCDLVSATQTEPPSREIPIGRPIHNVQMYVLDRSLQPVPIGVRGDLYIGGAGLAEGYLNRQDLTTQRFVPHPFSKDPGARLYNTGDLARFRPDGQIEFLGRTDDQVKIRGFRIELGEIEATLARHPDIGEVAVVAREDPPLEKRLVAYLVPKRSRNALPAADLVEFLGRLVPSHMIPSSFVFLDALPLTATGKVNRRALPRPERYNAPVSNDSSGEVGGTEETQLARMWEQVLGIQPIRVHDNFFELGGDSLHAFKLFTQIENLMGKRLPLATLLQAPTIAQLAAVLRTGDKGDHPRAGNTVGDAFSDAWSPLVPLRSRGSDPVFFLFHAAGGTILGYEPLTRHLPSEQPVYALQAVGLKGDQPPDLRIEDMAARYVRELRIRQPVGPYFLAGHSSGGLVAFEVARQLQTAGDTVAFLALFDTFNQAYLAKMPGRQRWKYRIFQAGDYLKMLVTTPARVSDLARRIGNSIAFRLWRANHGGRPNGNAALPDVLRQVEYANLLACYQYVPQPHAGRLTIFRAQVRAVGDPRDQLLGWDTLASEIEVHDVPGDHLSMIKEPHVQVLAERLTACLEKLRAPDASTTDTPTLSSRLGGLFTALLPEILTF